MGTYEKIAIKSWKLISSKYNPKFILVKYIEELLYKETIASIIQIDSI